MSIDWQAVSSFGAGLMALGAAVVVARKQAKILERQNATLEQQIATDAKLRENDIKLKLIDKRSAVIKELREVQSYFLQEAALDPVHDRRLWRLIQDAELLFPKEATGLLNELSHMHFKARLANRRAERQLKRGDEDVGNASLDEAMELEKNIFTKFPDALNVLIDHSAVRL